MDVVFLFRDILGVADNGVSLVVKCPDHPKFVDEGVMRVELKVVVCVRGFTVNSRIVSELQKINFQYLIEFICHYFSTGWVIYINIVINNYN